MHSQLLTNPPLKPLKGVLAVLGLLAAVMLDSSLTVLVKRFIGEGNAALMFWLIGIAIALWTMSFFTHGYSYLINRTMLRVYHRYGRHERHMLDVYMNNVVMTGTKENVKMRYPSARVSSAALKRNDAEILAVAYKDGGKISVLLVQPDETVKKVLNEAAKKNH